MAFTITRKKDGPKAEQVTNNFAPIPIGTYDAYIYNAEYKEFGGKGANAGRPAYNLSFKVAPGQPFAGRVLFLSPMLLLADRWAPTQNSPEGYPNRTLWEFLSAVDEEGRQPNDFVDMFNQEGELEIPDPRDIVGALVSIRVGVEKDKYAWETAGSPEGKQDEYQRNTIRQILPAKEAETENVVSAAVVDNSGKRKLEL